MRPTESLVPALALVAILMIFSGLARAEEIENHRTAPMPGNVNACHMFHLRPGEQVLLTASFECAWENCIQVYQLSSGTMLKWWNSHDGGGGQWLTPKNTTDATITLVVAFRHKNSPPNGCEPWRLSAIRVLDKAEGFETVGSEDGGGDSDWQDGLLNLTWVH